MRLLMTLIILLCVNGFASDFKVLTSLTSSHDFAGGIRYIKSAKEVIDFGVTYDQTQKDPTAGYWVDYYYGHFGAMISKPAKKAASYSLMFAAEGKLSSNVGIGIGFRILDMQQNREAKLFTSWDAYLVIPVFQ